MDKIGILTFHDTTNFGSWIQTYGLYLAIKKIGYSVEVIDYKCEQIKRTEKITLDYIRNIVSDWDILKIPFLVKKFRKQNSFKKYMKEFMLLGPKYTKDNIMKANNRYKAYIIGSDLVWDYRITGGDDVFLLEFATDDKIKCSYAASTGFEKYDDKEFELLKSLSRFDMVTVREIFDVTCLRENYGITAKCVCDPSLLIEREEWMKFVQDNVYGEYILLYSCDAKGSVGREAVKYSLKHHCKLVVVWDSFIASGVEVINAYPLNVSDFLTLIFFAKKVFTASYHGMMMSLIFEKQFSYADALPGSRMKSIAELVGIDEYNVDSKKYDMNSLVDYTQVNNKLNIFVETSKNILKGIVEKCI